MPTKQKVEVTTYNILIICAYDYTFKHLKDEAVGILYERGSWINHQQTKINATHLKTDEIDNIWEMKPEEFDFVIVDATKFDGKFQSIEAICLKFGFKDADILHIQWKNLQP